jgi:poly(A) polymerase
MVLSYLRKNVGFAMALAALFCDWPSEFGIERCRVLKLSRAQSRHIKALLNNRGVLLNAEMSRAQLRKIAAEPYFNDLYELERAIQKTKVGGRKSIEPLIKIKQRIKALGDIELKPRPLLDGHDLIQLGAKPGPVLGQLAEEMYIEQLEGTLQTASQAKDWVERWLAKHRPLR